MRPIGLHGAYARTPAVIALSETCAHGAIHGIFSAVKRFLSAGGVEFSEAKDKLDLEFGYVKIVDNGVKVHIKGKSLPLVASDLTQAGFVDGKLPVRKGSCTVTLQDWDIEQRRFIERLVEHIGRD